MTALKQEVFTLIEGIPDEKSEVLLKVLKSVREILGVNPNSRAERNIAIMKEVKDLIGDDIPWANEEEMIKEPAEIRKSRSVMNDGQSDVVF